MILLKRINDINSMDENVNLNNILKQKKKNPYRVSAGLKLAKHNRLKTLDLKKSDKKYYYIAVPAILLILYFSFRKSSTEYSIENKYSNDKKSKSDLDKKETIFEI